MSLSEFEPKNAENQETNSGEENLFDRAELIGNNPVDRDDRKDINFSDKGPDDGDLLG